MGKLLVFALLVACAGCDPSPLTEFVDGYVTLDGKPLAEVRVTLEPKSTGDRDSGVGAYGLTDESGHFVLRLSTSEAEGATLGLHSVILSDKWAEVDSDAGDIGRIPKSRIPEKYVRSPLTFEVRMGQTNTARFELTSD